jgi:hypothetical protein
MKQRPTANPASDLDSAVEDDSRFGPESSLVEMVEAVRALRYARPSQHTVEAMLRERRGTCSTKHLFPAQALSERFPSTEPQIIHRVYRLERELARRLYGEEIADIVPVEGLTDVHRYLTITLDGRGMTVDATFPGDPWDGRSSMPLACGQARTSRWARNPTMTSAHWRRTIATRRCASRSSWRSRCAHK